jgi:hypothetical protein
VPDDQPLPEDLVDLQRAVFAAQEALRAYDGDDPQQREALRQAEREAVLALNRHPGYLAARQGGGDWQDLWEAAGRPRTVPK